MGGEEDGLTLARRVSDVVRIKRCDRAGGYLVPAVRGRHRPAGDGRLAFVGKTTICAYRTTCAVTYM